MTINKTLGYVVIRSENFFLTILICNGIHI